MLQHTTPAANQAALVHLARKSLPAWRCMPTDSLAWCLSAATCSTTIQVQIMVGLWRVTKQMLSWTSLKWGTWQQSGKTPELSCWDTQTTALLTCIGLAVIQQVCFTWTEILSLRVPRVYAIWHCSKLIKLYTVCSTRTCPKAWLESMLWWSWWWQCWCADLIVSIPNRLSTVYQLLVEVCNIAHHLQSAWQLRSAW